MKRLFVYLVICFSFCKEKTNQNILEQKMVEKSNLPYDIFNNYVYPHTEDDIFDSLFALNKKNQLSMTCNSIEEVLAKVYYLDQLFRDSVIFYRRKEDFVKVKFFEEKMKEADNVTLKLLTPLIEDLQEYKECINSSNAFNAIWLVAIHNRNKELIRDICPIIEYGHIKEYIDEDAFELYARYYNSLTQK